MRVRLRLFTLLVGLGLALGGAASADAAKPSFSHDMVDVTFDGSFCGVPASVHYQLNGHQFIFTHSGAFPYFKGNGLTRITWTNPVNGATAELFSSGSTKDLSIVDNGDGTITILSSNSGNSTVSAGGVVFHDVGRVLTQVLVDYNETPGDPNDDSLIGVPQIVGENGSHPFLGNDPVDLCAALLPSFTA